mmetsp:Transcript_9748/g.25577  ORF Transcript_9748/g.25577 Transcript_9748/m.25577 type:complete len:96 (-) Transcript_9748:106-393(-)|eukprot:CAMPEP_0117575614 /NCGR_PEP_ID=MMETSP0784-20121206/62305_1 /TAXON_ID=39447 /ORGANISM="" /LENGTH=95 /DNA_ID=CAMNT_0005374705 /DNA_START=78 /DNA_END=365 /DNA_ORIENTATION=-
MAPKSAEGASASTGNRAAAATVGGSRTALARRPAGRSGTVAAQGSGRKAGGGGLLNFYTDDTPGLKVGPTTVLVLSLVFMAIVCSLHIMGKFRSS